MIELEKYEAIVDYVKILNGQITTIRDQLMKIVELQKEIIVWLKQTNKLFAEQLDTKEILEKIHEAIIITNTLLKNNTKSTQKDYENNTKSLSTKKDNVSIEEWEQIDVPFDKAKREAFKTFCKNTEGLEYRFDGEKKQWFIKGSKDLIAQAKKFLT